MQKAARRSRAAAVMSQYQHLAIQRIAVFLNQTGLALHAQISGYQQGFAVCHDTQYAALVVIFLAGVFRRPEQLEIYAVPLPFVFLAKLCIRIKLRLSGKQLIGTDSRYTLKTTVMVNIMVRQNQAVQTAHTHSVQTRHNTCLCHLFRSRIKQKIAVTRLYQYRQTLPCIHHGNSCHSLLQLGRMIKHKTQ